MTEKTSEGRSTAWVRFQVGFLTILLLALVVYRVFVSDPPGQIDISSLLILLLVVVLILSEAFDNFSVGRLISISREVSKKQDEVARLEGANERLFNQLISVTTNQSQAMNPTLVYGDYHAGRVEPATPDEIKEGREKELEELKSARRSLRPTPREARGSSKAPLNFQKVEDFGLQEYINANNILPKSIIKSAKLVSEFHDIDGISNTAIIFDGYVKGKHTEKFIEIRPNSGSMVFRDRLYMMLSKIKNYGYANNRKASLDLVLVKTSNRQELSSSMDRIIREFEPAIRDGLLRIIPLEVADDQKEQFYGREP